MEFVFLISWFLLVDNSSCVTLNVPYSPDLISQEINTTESYFFLANNYVKAFKRLTFHAIQMS